jgi:hypothetical protein
MTHQTALAPLFTPILHPNGTLTPPEIRFSKIRDSFGFSSGELRASNFIRDTNVNNTNPKIPDATENSNIPTSSTSQWKASYFTNTLKTYEVIQYDTDTNLSLSSVGSWNSNLGKNIPKIYKISGRINGTTSNGYALTLDGTTYNLTVEVRGYVLGYGGAGGVRGASGVTETVSSNVSANINIVYNDTDNEIVKLVTSGTGTATVQMYAGMRDYSNRDKRPWRYIDFQDDNGSQTVYVEPGSSTSNSDREEDFYINLAVSANASYSIDVRLLRRPLSWFTNYGSKSNSIPDRTVVSGFSMRDVDNDTCRGQVKINSITQGSYSRQRQGTDGEDGGHAINVLSSGSKIKIVELSGGNRIRGGGGGGGAGKDGVAGTGGLCDTYDKAVNNRTSTTRCRATNMDSDRAKFICKDLGSGYSSSSRNNSGDCCEREPDRVVCVRRNAKGVCKQEETRRGACIKWTTYVYCWNNYATSGGAAGLGGNGGHGRGSNWNQLDGSTDKPITAPDYGAMAGPTRGGAGGGCGATSGTDGVKGGDGGPWNTAGQSVSGAGSGGTAGIKISGTNWTY